MSKKHKKNRFSNVLKMTHRAISYTVQERTRKKREKETET